MAPENKKVVPEGCIRFNANIKKDFHLRLKVMAAMSSRTMGEIIEEWIEKYSPTL